MSLSGSHIWLVGASEGIGRILAKDLAEQGAHVALSARSEDRLNALLNELPDGEHLVEPCDVSDTDSVEQAFQAIHNHWGMVDKVIFNAGIYTPMGAKNLDLGDMLLTTEVNLNGAYRVVASALPVFRAQKKGHLVLVGSVAGYRGLPNAVGYGQSKAALNHLAECLELDLHDEAIDVQLVSPGFVKTRLTDKNDFSMPALITPEKASAAIVKGMQNPKQFEIHFPKRFTLMLKFLGLLPYSAYSWVVKRTLL